MTVSLKLAWATFRNILQPYPYLVFVCVLDSAFWVKEACCRELNFS